MDVTIVGPGDGEAIQIGPIRMRLLEDGSTTDHRLGVGEITLAASYRRATSASPRPPR